MARPWKPPYLVPQQPATVLGWSLQKFRIVHGWEVKEVAAACGCKSSHISRIEHGKMPSDEVVRFYEQTFGAEGLLNSIYQVAVDARTDKRRTVIRKVRPRPAVKGDASEFLGATIPNGTLMEPGQFFVKTWRIRNSGSVTWRGRSLKRQGPITGPGLISSPAPTVLPLQVPDTDPGHEAEIGAVLKAPTYDCAAIAYFKMVDSDGKLCFPDNYQLGLEVLVIVRGQVPDKESVVEAYLEP